MKLFHLALVTVFGSALPSLALSEPTEAAVAAAQACDGGNVIGDAAVGDLNGDGQDDLAAFVSCDGTPKAQQLIAFVRTSSRSYRLLAKTSIEPHLRRWDSVNINRGILTVRQGCSAACNSNWNRSFKFRWHAGVMQLIGEDQVNSEVSAENGPNGPVNHDRQYGSSINYASRTAVYWRTSKTPAKKIRRTTRISSGSNASLQDFDFDRLVPEVHGYINEKFELTLLKE